MDVLPVLRGEVGKMSGINVEDVLYALRTCSMDNATKCKECAYVQEGDCYVMMMRDAEAVIRGLMKEERVPEKPARVAHFKATDCYDTLACSACNQRYMIPIANALNYCPNCGAIMEREGA